MLSFWCVLCGVCMCLYIFYTFFILFCYFHLLSSLAAKREAAIHPRMSNTKLLSIMHPIVFMTEHMHTTTNIHDMVTASAVTSLRCRVSVCFSVLYSCQVVALTPVSQLL